MISFPWRQNLGLALAVLFSVAAITVAAVLRAHDQAAIERTAERNCRSIELLKTEFRAEAQESFENLVENARLLGIAVTPELRAVARRRLDKKLARFAAQSCNNT